MSSAKSKKIRKGRGVIIFIVIISVIAIFLLVQYILCRIAVNAGYKRLEAYQSKEIELSCGTVTYVDKGDGDVILSIHGIFGGYDQAFDNVENLASEYRIIAPSRFGYLRSDAPGDTSPKEQARVFAELLDELNVDKVFLLATSAGGTVAIRFALDYPERTKGLILYSSAMPLKEKPDSFQEYLGPPTFLCNNFGMWLLRPFFNLIMGMEPNTIYSMLPINERYDGVMTDASVTNPDMARNFDEYIIENLQAPVLIFQVKDDKMANYEQAEQAISRFPDCTFIVFETGGHLMVGHGEEINKELNAFLGKNK